MTIFWMILAIILGSAVSLAGGIALLKVKKRRAAALLLTMPFAAGALLAAAFFDLLPEAFELADPGEMLLYMLGGFLVFFLLERFGSWFHHHHAHDEHKAKDTQHTQQRRLIVLGDLAHNAIDGIAIGAAFLVSIPTGIVTTLAVATHEIPKEVGTFALLLGKGWKDKVVIWANIATAVATVVAAVVVYLVAAEEEAFVAPLLAVTAGFFLYVAASDIIPDIHEQPHRQGMIQAAMLVVGLVVVAVVIQLLHV